MYEQYSQVDGYYCVDHKTFSYSPPSQCPVYIKGVCKGENFHAGLEKYFVSELEAKDLESKLLSEESYILVSVIKTGQALIKELHIGDTLMKPGYQSPSNHP